MKEWSFCVAMVSGEECTRDSLLIDYQEKYEFNALYIFFLMQIQGSDCFYQVPRRISMPDL